MLAFNVIKSAEINRRIIATACEDYRQWLMLAACSRDAFEDEQKLYNLACPLAGHRKAKSCKGIGRSPQLAAFFRIQRI